jgi:PBP1b-binding outer membrane lipoprotein LpoB
MKLYLIVILLLLFIVASCCNNKPVEHFANNDQKELSSADKLKVDKLAEKWETAWKPVIK